MRNLVVLPRAILLTLVCLLTLSTSPALADEQELAERSLRALPSDVLGVLVLHDAERCQQALQQPLEQFGGPPLPVGTFLGNLSGADPNGLLLLGLAEAPSGVPALFLMIPVDDFDQFVEALEATGDGEPVEIDLAGQRLLAHKRGEWALLTSATAPLAEESYEPSAAIVSAMAPYLADERRGGLVALVPGDGLERMKTLVQTTEKSPAEIDRMRRMFRASTMRWHHPTDWQELILMYGPLVESLAEHTAGATLQVRFGNDGGATLDGSLLARPRETPPTDDPSSTAQLPQLGAPQGKAFLAVAGPTRTPWTSAAVELFLGHLASRGNELGITQYPPDEWEGFRQSVHSLVGETSGASLVVIAPPDESPQLANQAFLLKVADSQQFLQTAQEVTVDWNRLIENSQREVDLVFDARPLEIEGIAGTRFAVDLPTAFKAHQVPEVRTVLMRLFGNTGEMQIDVLPLDATHVLVSQFPPETTTEVVKQLLPVDEGEAQEAWEITFTPQVFQDWQNTTFRASVDGNIIGWKPRRFGSAATVGARVVPAADVLRFECEVPAEIVASWAQFLRAKRRPGQ